MPKKSNNQKVDKKAQLSSSAKFQGTQAASLNECEERFRILFEASPVAIIVLRDERIRSSNPTSARMLGYKDANEMVGLSAFSLVSPQSKGIFLEHFKQINGEKTNPLTQIELIRKDGIAFTVECIFSSIPVDGIPAAVIIAHDVSQYKELKMKLRECEDRFRSFMENNPAAIYIKDENDIHIYGNPAIFEALNTKPEEFIGSTTRDLWPTRIADKLIALDRKVRDSGIPMVAEESRTTKKGHKVWRQDNKFPIRLESGEKLLGGISIDISEIKQNEQKLQKAYDEIKRLKEKLEQENIYLHKEIELHHRHKEILGKSELIMGMLNRAEQVAETDTSVLILGETGTGKELLAHAIHSTSSRKKRPMIQVNCAALPPTLIETELFGREKGAYTGALTKQKGRFELADGSTLFLDEISELPLELQPKLLRVLQEGCFERLGSSKIISVNARIMAATNQDLSEMVRNGRFRKDLYYRLNVFPITVPPLRERQEDIPLLVWAFVKEFEETMPRRIKHVTSESMEALQHYPWPGNVRELRNVIEQAMIISKDEVLNVQLPAGPDLVTEPEIKLVDVERKHILKILLKTGWRIKGKYGAAELLDLHPATLYSKMKRLGIQKPAKL